MIYVYLINHYDVFQLISPQQSQPSPNRNTMTPSAAVRPTNQVHEIHTPQTRDANAAASSSKYANGGQDKGKKKFSTFTLNTSSRDGGDGKRKVSVSSKHRKDVKMIVDMGFSDEQATWALQEANNDRDVAISKLLG